MLQIRLVCRVGEYLAGHKEGHLGDVRRINANTPPFFLVYVTEHQTQILYGRAGVHRALGREPHLAMGDKIAGPSAIRHKAPRRVGETPRSHVSGRTGRSARGGTTRVDMQGHQRRWTGSWQTGSKSMPCRCTTSIEFCRIVCRFSERDSAITFPRVFAYRDAVPRRGSKSIFRRSASLRRQARSSDALRISARSIADSTVLPRPLRRSTFAKGNLMPISSERRFITRCAANDCSSVATQHRGAELGKLFRLLPGGGVVPTYRERLV